MRKIISTILVITLVFTVTLPVYAYEDIKTPTNYDEVVALKAQIEINAMEEMVWDDLYDQLAAQNALDGFELFQDFLRPEIESAVYDKYGITSQSVAAASDTRTYSFPKGGMVSYSGSLNTDNVVLCMNKEDTLKYYYDNTANFGDLLLSVLSFIPGTTLIGLAATANIALTASAKKEIKAAGYYSKFVTISWGGGAERGTYAYGWKTHPKCTVTGVTKIKSVKYGV